MFLLLEKKHKISKLLRKKTKNLDLNTLTEQLFCGVEQETNIPYPHSSWIETGGFIYDDNGLEICTPLVPISEDENYDSALELYKATITDRAHTLNINQQNEKHKKGVFVRSMHFNFPEPRECIEDLLRRIAPTLELFMGRNESLITYNYKIGDRFEICTNNLENPASVVGGSAITIAATTALKKGELKLEDFEYYLPESVLLENSNSCRYLINFESVIKKAGEVVFEGESITEYGRDTEIYTAKGIKKILDVARSTVETLKPHILKYCSKETYDLIEDTLNGNELTDLDIDLLIQEGELPNNKSEFDYTKANFKKKYGITPKQAQTLYEPQNLSKMFSEISKKPELERGNYKLTINRSDWFVLKMRVSKKDSISYESECIGRKNIFEFYEKYKKIKKGEISIEDFYKEVKHKKSEEYLIT